MCHKNTVKPVLSGHSILRPKFGSQDRLSLNAGQKYCRMLKEEHSAIFSTFIKLPWRTSGLPGAVYDVRLNLNVLLVK